MSEDREAAWRRGVSEAQRQTTYLVGGRPMRGIKYGSEDEDEGAAGGQDCADLGVGPGQVDGADSARGRRAGSGPRQRGRERGAVRTGGGSPPARVSRGPPQAGS